VSTLPEVYLLAAFVRAWRPALLPYLREHRRRNHRLAVAQTAITGTNDAVLKNLKTLFFEPGAQQPREAAIVHAAA
jgi:hypothetical protein